MNGLKGTSSELIGQITLEPSADLDNTKIVISNILINDDDGSDTVDTLNFATGHSVSGDVSHWNGLLPLDGIVTLAGVDAESKNDLIQFRDFELLADGTATVELWANILDGSAGSIDFGIRHSSSLALKEYSLGSSFDEWETLITNNETLGELRISALSLDLTEANYIRNEKLLGNFHFDILNDEDHT